MAPQDQESTAAVSETPTDTTPAAPETSPIQEKIAAGLSAIEAGVKAPESTPAAPVDAPPAYSPNYKFTVMDKEHEIPEMFRPLIKDKETEAKVREVYEKALGLDFVKPKLQAEKSKREEVEKNWSSLTSQVRDAGRQYQEGVRTGDMTNFFKSIDVSEEKILQHFLNKINYSKLPPEQQQALDARRSAEQRAMDVERQFQSTQAEQSNQLGQAVQMMLDSTLARADVKPAVDAFDARAGAPGAFRDEVARRGDYYWRTTGKLVPPEQVVQEVLRLVGPAPAPQAAAAPTQVVPPVTNAQGKVPVIPNIGGRTTSPVPQKPRSIADLREIRKNL